MRNGEIRAVVSSALLVGLVSLSGCGGGDAEKEADEAATSQVPAASPTPTPTESPTESAEATEPTEPTESETPSPSPTEPEDPFADYRDQDGFASADDYGKDWPLKVPAGFLVCAESFGDRNGAVIFRTLDGDEYALNGQAAHDYPDIRPIWANDPTYGKNSGIKMSTMILLIDDALDLC